MNNLNPCPFCGGEVKKDFNHAIVYVLCDKCGAVVSFRQSSWEPVNVDRLWNKRVPVTSNAK